MDKNRFLSYVAWDKITRPLAAGGLGIKELAVVNEALLIKVLWKIASGSKALWVGIVTAKYLPRSDLWLSKRIYKCTSLWRGVMNAREKLLPLLTWRVGDGLHCKAFAQPWVPGAGLFIAANPEHKTITLRDLCEDESGLWNLELLIELFGHQNSMHIIANVTPPRDEAGLDIDSRVWEIIWHKGRVLPRIRMFFWKVMHGALPLGTILATRVSRGDPICHVCGVEEEDVRHMLFLCPFARACWFHSPLALRTENLNMEVDETFRGLSQHLSDEEWTQLANTVWAIWRCRNEKTYGGQIPSIEMFNKLYVVAERESRIAATISKELTVLSNAIRLQQNSEIAEITCYVDGSWREPWLGGLGFIIEQGINLVAYMAAPTKTSCPIHAEAAALSKAIKTVKRMGIATCTFFSDNQTLVQTCMALQPPVEADWRAYREMYEIWLLSKENNYNCLHVNRSQNSVADHLAKAGSEMFEGQMGFTYPTFPPCNF